MARVPSGEPSSTIMSSQSKLLRGRGELVRWCSWFRGGIQRGDGLDCESSLEKPADYGEIAALVVGGEDDGVFFFRIHA